MSESHEPFVVGAAVTVALQGREPMTSVVVEPAPGERRAGRTVVDEPPPLLRHELQRRAGGGAPVAHRPEVDGRQPGPKISDDFPGVVGLLAGPERGAHG